MSSGGDHRQTEPDDAEDVNSRPHIGMFNGRPLPRPLSPLLTLLLLLPPAPPLLRTLPDSWRRQRPRRREACLAW